MVKFYALPWRSAAYPVGFAAYRSSSFPSQSSTLVDRMDPASVALSEGLEPNELRTYAALSQTNSLRPDVGQEGECRSQVVRGKCGSTSQVN
jgi:hypothetical protein